SMIWLMEAEALFFAGIWAKEVVFTRLGLLTGFFAAGQMIGIDAFRLLADRMNDQRLDPDYHVGLLVLGFASAIFYANAYWVPARWKQPFTGELDQNLLKVTSYVAGILAITSLWMAFPDVWTAVLWSAFALSLAFIARRTQVDDLAIQANIISAAA